MVDKFEEARIMREFDVAVFQDAIAKAFSKGK
jgi:hypothetical protein